MLKNVSACLILLFCALSCNTPSANDGSNSEAYTADSSDSSHIFNIAKIEKCEFSVQPLSQKMKDYIKDPDSSDLYVKFHLNFILKNESSNKFTSFKYEGHVEATFADDDKLRLPYDFRGMYATESTQEKTWEPYTTRGFDFWYYGNDDYRGTSDLRVSQFKRTPIECNFVFNYKAISVDKECDTVQKINIIDQWKDFQSEQGLR